VFKFSSVTYYKEFFSSYQGQDGKIDEEQHHDTSAFQYPIERVLNGADDAVHVPRSTLTQKHFARRSRAVPEVAE
jgi:hypothetical protein